MSDNTMTSFELRATWGLGIVFSLRLLGLFMVTPVLTTYGMALNDATEMLIGVAIGVYGLTQALFQIPLGLASDQIGRKPLIIGGLFIFILGSVIAATTHSIWGIIFGRALQGAGAIAAVVMALISDLNREQNRTKAMALVGISFGVTFAIAMVIGPLITHAFGLHILFWCAAVFAFIGIIITITVVPNTRTHLVNRESNIIYSGIHKVLRNPALLKLNFSVMCLHTLLISCFVALPLAMEKVGLKVNQHWKIYFFTLLLSFLPIIPFIICAEKYRRMKQVFIGCIFILFCAEIVLWFSYTTLWMLISGMLLFFIAFNMLEAILPSWISKESPASYKGTAMGIYSTCQFIGVAIGGFLGGKLYSSQSADTVFIAGAVLTAMWLIIACTMKQPLYLSSLRIPLSIKNKTNVNHLRHRLLEQPGVVEVIVIYEEQSVYVKIDTKKTDRTQLETLIG